MDAISDEAPAAGVAEPLTLGLGARLAPRLALAGVVVALLGLAIVVAVVADPPSGGAVVGSAVVAGVVLLFGAFCLYAAWSGAGLRIVLDDRGIHWRSRRRSADLRWDDVEEVGLSVTTWSPPAVAPVGFGRGERTTRITLVLREPDGPRVAPALRHLRRGDEPEPWTHWVTLGTNADWAAEADAALGRLVGARYAGVHERETFRRRYS